MRILRDDQPTASGLLKAFALALLAVAFLLPVLCGSQHVQHQANRSLAGACASVMTLAVAFVGSLFALVLIRTLAPPAYALSIPLLYHPIPKPPH